MKRLKGVKNKEKGVITEKKKTPKSLNIAFKNSQYFSILFNSEE